MNRQLKTSLMLGLFFVVFSSYVFAYDMVLTTDKYFYAINESIYAAGFVKANNTNIANVSVVFAANGTSGTVATYTNLTNSTGQFNYTFTVSSAGALNLTVNASGDYVQHFVKVLPYKDILIRPDKQTYSSGSSGVITFNTYDVNGNGVSGQAITSNIYSTNKTLVSALSSCTTDSLGECRINFTVPSTDGEYVIEANNFEQAIRFMVGGFEPSMKISPSVTGLNTNITLRLILKNAAGNGIAASTRQLVITYPNGTTYTVSSMTQYADDSGTSLTGVYQDIFANTTSEGVYFVKITVVPQGSNITRELYGTFEIRGYTMDIVPWFGTSVFYPGSTVTLGIKLRNASSNDFMANKLSALTSGISIYDTSDKPMTLSISLSEVSAMSMYRVSFTMPTSLKSGTYKIRVFINDSVGTGNGVGYFTVQTAKSTVFPLEKFNGMSKRVFLPGKPIVLKFSAVNVSGAVAVTGISSYSIFNEFNEDKTAEFLGRSNYTSGNDSYINMTAPKLGGWYTVRAKLSTAVGIVAADGWFDVNVFSIMTRPTSSNGSSGSGNTPFGGPGYMFAFRPEDEVQFTVTVTVADEEKGMSGFKGGPGGGPSGPGGPMMMEGMFGMGAGSAVSGAKVVVTKIINTQTEEDVTSSATITNGITDTAGAATIKLKSAVNNQKWSGGFYMVFMNVTSKDNQTDTGEGFFEVRKYFVNVQTTSAAASNASTYGFMSFNSWNIGPTDNVNVTVTVIQPGNWTNVNTLGNVTILGVYYTGGMGEYVYPPRKIDNTNATGNINGTYSTLINVSLIPGGRWKSGFYIVRVIVNVSNYTDSGEGFMMSRVYEGWAQNINPTTLQNDFTTRTDENATFKVSVYDVLRHSPAANLTVTMKKILTMDSFPPSDYTTTYDKNVSQATTDATGGALITLPTPSSGWATGDYIVSFDVTNGTVSDTIEGWFQVRAFFVDMQPGKWQFAANETVVFNVTISSDPSWMRYMFGGGGGGACPPGDPMCGGGSTGGGAMGGGGGGEMNWVTVAFDEGQDIDGDSVKDVNISNPTGYTNMINATGGRKIQYMGCMSGSACSPGDSEMVNFESFNCDNLDTNGNTIALNASGSRYYCLKSSINTAYKIRTDVATSNNVTIQYIKYVAGSVGGSADINMSGGTYGMSYYNATLRSVKVVKFDWLTGEQVLREGVNYNITSANGVVIGIGNVTIPGVGSVKIKPIGTWSDGYYRVVMEFNISATSSESGESGFGIQSYMTNCYRSGSWGTVASGTPIDIVCEARDPSSNQAYANPVEVKVASVKNTMTWQDVSSGWNTTVNYTNSTNYTAVIQLGQSLTNGMYQANMRFNSTPSETKENSIWFEIKDMNVYLWTTKWMYAASENVSLVTEGWPSTARVTVNLSSTPTIYKYDRATWAKTTVTGFSAVGIVDQNQLNQTFINISKTGGWDEGQYEVVVNVVRINSTGSAIGNPVEVHTWFEIKLFDAWAWPECWSNYPTNNITFYISTYAAGSSTQYNGSVTASITKVYNQRTGQTLVQGTHYNVVDNTTNPSNTGNIVIKIMPISALPGGDYTITTTVTDATSGKSITITNYISVVAYYLSVFSDPYEVTYGENATLFLSTWSPGGSEVNITMASISYMYEWNPRTSVYQAITTPAYGYNASKRIYINTTQLTAGNQYNGQIEVNDSQNISTTAWFSFSVKSFSFNAFVAPLGSSRWAYYINETIPLNVTASIGTNITNATISRWDCGSGNCVEKIFVRVLSVNMTSQNQLVNLLPVGINNSWPTDSWGYSGFSINLRALKDGQESSLVLWTSVQFPWQWNVTTENEVAPSAAIPINASVYLDYYSTIRLNETNASVKQVFSETDYSSTEINSSKWSSSVNASDRNGFVNITLSPTTGNTWPTGKLRIRLLFTYGNATTTGDVLVTVNQPSLRVWASTYRNFTNGIDFNSTRIITNSKFNMSVMIYNPTTTAAPNTTVVITLPVHSSNSSAIVTSYGNRSLIINISTGWYSHANYTFNVTAAGNYSGMITVTPSVTAFTTLAVPYTFTTV
ncbi:MAG: hypothetical protein HZB67_00450 [Candidatus Aenigmarchaeota archaeon]|nr:hypothetical protein [Candidatus Aenigmarchaeota archaeon]